MKLKLSKGILFLNIGIQCILSLSKHPYSKKLKLKFQKKLKESFNIVFNIDRLKFEKINVITFKNIAFSSSQYSGKIKLLKISAKLSMSSGLRIIHPSIFAENMHLIVPNPKYRQNKKNSTNNNYSSSKNNFKSYSSSLFRITFLLVKYFPRESEFINCDLTFKKYQCSLKRLLLKDNFFTVSFSKNELILKRFDLKGSFEKKSHLIKFKNIIFNNNSKVCFLSQNTKFSFEELGVKVALLSKKKITIDTHLTNGFFQTPSISSEKIKISKIKCCLNLSLLNSHIKLEEPSYFVYNDLKLNLFLSQEFQRQILNIKISAERFTMEQFFKSFSSFKYKPLYSLKFTGEITAINFAFFINLNQPWRHILKLKIRQNLELDSHRHWPDFNSSFSHQVFDNGRHIKNIHIEDSHLRSCLNKNQTLIQTILFTEDPDFFKHNGVQEKFIGYAIAQNLTEKKFLRGGSTITMQLVRNLLLSHEKTVFRKVEEVLITLILENLFNLSKDRILELYLNIIELAPNIYGIKDGCKYYFNKKPSHLTPKECIVLSYIIPRPKYFMEAFENSSEQLRVNLRNHLEFFSKKLLETGFINEKEMHEMVDSVQIQGKTLFL